MSLLSKCHSCEDKEESLIQTFTIKTPLTWILKSLSISFKPWSCCLFFICRQVKRGSSKGEFMRQNANHTAALPHPKPADVFCSIFLCNNEQIKSAVSGLLGTNEATLRRLFWVEALACIPPARPWLLSGYSVHDNSLHLKATGQSSVKLWVIFVWLVLFPIRDAQTAEIPTSHQSSRIFSFLSFFSFCPLLIFFSFPPHLAAVM